MTAQFLEIAGNKVAVLPIADYERLLELAEDQADLRAADAAEQRRLAGEEYVPMELVNRIIAGEGPLLVWRTYRGLTLSELAMKTGTTEAVLSQIENGQGEGPLELWRKIAEALKVDMEDILPIEDLK